MRLPVIFATAMALLPLSGQLGATCRAESGERLVPLVELYTSEGCDSCPAADRWLSRHFPAGRATDAVALAFHVDYWDRLGWKDRFASPAFTSRQHEAMRANRATFVYTPQLVVQGRDFPGWRRSEPASAIAGATSRPPRARIALQATLEAPSVVVRAEAKLVEAPRQPLSLALAYVDSRLTSSVKSGENRGVTLTHDHVVRALETRPVTATAAAFDIRLPRPAEAGEHPMLVAFVQDPASGDVLQTLALALDGCR